jgi:hypothetical protein
VHRRGIREPHAPVPLLLHQTLSGAVRPKNRRAGVRRDGQARDDVPEGSRRRTRQDAARQDGATIGGAPLRRSGAHAGPAVRDSARRRTPAHPSPQRSGATSSPRIIAANGW